MQQIQHSDVACSRNPQNSGLLPFEPTAPQRQQSRDLQKRYTICMHCTLTSASANAALNSAFVASSSPLTAKTDALSTMHNKLSARQDLFLPAIVTEATMLVKIRDTTRGLAPFFKLSSSLQVQKAISRPNKACSKQGHAVCRDQFLKANARAHESLSHRAFLQGSQKAHM